MRQSRYKATTIVTEPYSGLFFMFLLYSMCGFHCQLLILLNSRLTPENIFQKKGWLRYDPNYYMMKSSTSTTKNDYSFHQSTEEKDRCNEENRKAGSRGGPVEAPWDIAICCTIFLKGWFVGGKAQKEWWNIKILCFPQGKSTLAGWLSDNTLTVSRRTYRRKSLTLLISSQGGYTSTL